MKTLFLIIISSILGGIMVNAQQIEGKVHCEGVGIEGVVVTDGIRVTTTNSQGEYNFQGSDETKFVYISTPSGYLTEVKNKTVPQFYKEKRNEVNRYDFELKQNPKSDEQHMFIVQTDVQMANNDDLNLYKNLLPKCADFIKENNDKDIFGFNCGDITGDNLNIIPGYLDAASVLDIPIYRAIGNHDMDYYGRSHVTSYRTFNSHFGPTYYSFNKGDAHYIVLNNTFYIGRDYFYIGYLDEKAFSWLEKDLSYVPKDSPVFVILHIPSRLNTNDTPFTYGPAMGSDMINYKSFHNLLKDYNVNIISGHMHYTKNVVHSDKMFEHITPAVSGAWWQGDVCVDGTPQGYGVYNVNGKDVSWHFKAFNHPQECQFRAYPAGTYKDNPNDIVANVWNWDPKWKVEWFENGVYKGGMTQFTGVDADAVELCSKQKKYPWISAHPTDHLFKATPSNPKASIKIKVTDRFGNTYEQTLKK